jgi:tetratricopeptide (TPR) repeat protein
VIFAMAAVAALSGCGGATGGGAGDTSARIQQSDSAVANLRQAVELWRNAEYAAAANAAERAAKLGGLNARQRAIAEAIQGAAWVNAEQTEKALPFLDSAIAAHPELGFAHSYRAEAVYLDKEYRPTIASASRAIRLLPNWSRPYLMRALSHARLREVAPALADMNRVIELAPGRSPYLAMRGALHEMAGNLALAVADYREAVRADPDNETARQALARALSTAAQRGGPAAPPVTPPPRTRDDAPIIRL